MGDLNEQSLLELMKRIRAEGSERLTVKPTRVLRPSTYICKVPDELGAVTKLEAKRGKVVARTESGHTMIVPVRGKR